MQSNAIPETVYYEDKIYKISQAIEMLQNPDLSAAEKNAFLKTFIDHIEYFSELPGKGNRFLENKFSLEIFFL